MASRNAILLAAAMSEVSGNRVITHHDFTTKKLGDVKYLEMDTNALHQSHLVGGAVPNNIINAQQGNAPPSNEEINISVKPLSGKAFSLKVRPLDTIYNVKQKIQDVQGTLPEIQRLLFQGDQLENGRTVASCDIKENTEIFLVLRQRGGEDTYYINSAHLAPSYDYDFTNINDAGATHMRGQYQYRRPCGWNRVALQVLGKYGDDVWLGSGTTGWPVSYHGTSRHNNNTIAEDGNNYAGNRNFNFSHGIYSTPDVEVALKYATRFVFNGENYAVIFQNRVNPANLERITAPNGAGEYWISRNGGDVRSYGICMRKV